MKTCILVGFALLAVGVACSSPKMVPPVAVESSAPVVGEKSASLKKKGGTQEQIRAKIERLAKEAEPDALRQREKVLADATKEHEDDVAGYRFKVSRWGDWLEISLARQPHDKKEPVQKFSTSINLGLVTTVHIQQGHAPDEEGSLSYYATFEPDAKQHEDVRAIRFFGDCNYGEPNSPPAGYHWKITPDIPDAPRRQLFEETKPNTIQWMGGYYCGGGAQTQFRTDHFVRFAEDDVIYFDGIATLYAPAGLGEGVYRQILAAKDSSGR